MVLFRCLNFRHPTTTHALPPRTGVDDRTSDGWPRNVPPHPMQERDGTPPRREIVQTRCIPLTGRVANLMVTMTVTANAISTAEDSS